MVLNIPSCGIADPVADAARGAALASYGILDTPTEPVFDDIVQLAADICETPIAVVNFVGEDRQWFKAEVGIGQRELPLDVSICRHAILQPGVLVVPDLREDARFEENPLVTALDGVRFYAGALLETPEGVAIGTVCVLDRKPRPEGLTERQERMLHALARQVMSELELRKALERRRAEVIRSKLSETAFQETSRRLDAIINNTMMALFVMDERQHCVFMNKAAEKLTGYELAETLGRPLHDVIHHKYPDGRHYPLEECPIDRAFPERNQVQGEELFVHKDGSFYPVAFTASPIRGDDGEPIGTIIEARSIAEEQEISAALNERTATLEVLNRVGSATAAELDLGKIVQLVTDAGTEISGAHFGAFFYNSINEAGDRMLLYALSGADRSQFDSFGHPRPTEVFAPTFNGEGVIRSDDITSDPRYGKNDPYFGMPKGHLPVRSYLAAPVVSRSGEVIGGLFFGHPEPGRFLERHERLVTGIAAQAAVAVDNGRLYQAQQHELARRRSAEEKLQQLAAQLEQKVEERTAERDRMWQLSTDLMMVAQFDGTITAVNPAWTSLLGWSSEELIGSSFFGLLHPDDVGGTSDEAAALAEGRPTKRFENRYRTKSGDYRWLSWTAVPDQKFIHAVARDVTPEKEQAAELEQAQDALRQAQKMEAIGQLTGGIAHDFNNLLTVILGSADILRRQDLSEEKRTRYVDAIGETAERAAKLTSQLLAFARRQSLEPVVFDVVERIHSVTQMLRPVMGSRIEVEVVSECDPCHTEADITQLETAILNMSVNARDAMGGEGKLTITVSAETGIQLEDGSGEREGEFVAIKVSDTGEGIAPDQLGRIFEPFFTTKRVGQGTGLGLSQVFGFAKQSGGEVRVESEVGVGTTFSLYLPKVEAPEHRSNRGNDAALAQKAPNGCVLVVEDNCHVGEFATQLLADLGYETVLAPDAEAALKLIEEGQQVDVMFTDVVMPGMSGVDLAKEFERRRPGVPVVLASGYSHILAEEGAHGFPLLQKPYSVEALSKAIRAALAA
ncbi:MAG TPA: PAS domain S-box protein [Allosphingosinicella sp.]|nr:PAS domain S-box protein [Allosphingosinicella sp.]